MNSMNVLSAVWERLKRNWVIPAFVVASFLGSLIVWTTFGLGLINNKPSAVPWIGIWVTFVGLLAAVVQLSITLSRLQRAPDIRIEALIYGDLQRTGKGEQGQNYAQQYTLLANNDGNAVAVWFSVIIRLPNEGYPLFGRLSRNQPPSWSDRKTDRAFFSQDGRYNDIIFQSFGEAACFPNSPLELGRIRVDYFEDEEHEAAYEVAYEVFGDWGTPQIGAFKIRTPLEILGNWK